MAKSKKTKIHKKIDGQLLQMNKSFNNLKLKQKEKITAWVYKEYKKYVTENEKVPDLEADEHIIDEVLDKINEAQIWIPSGEIVSYYYRKKANAKKFQNIFMWNAFLLVYVGICSFQLIEHIIHKYNNLES